jgi:hypothetical protein
MRSQAEIEQVHDLLCDVLLERTPLRSDANIRHDQDLATEVLCWVLGHTPEGPEDFENGFELMLAWLKHELSQQQEDELERPL